MLIWLDEIFKIGNRNSVAHSVEFFTESLSMLQASVLSFWKSVFAHLSNDGFGLKIVLVILLTITSTTLQNQANIAFKQSVATKYILWNVDHVLCTADDTSFSSLVTTSSIHPLITLPSSDKILINLFFHAKKIKCRTPTTGTKVLTALWISRKGTARKRMFKR